MHEEVTTRCECASTDFQTSGCQDDNSRRNNGQLHKHALGAQLLIHSSVMLLLEFKPLCILPLLSRMHILVVMTACCALMKLQRRKMTECAQVDISMSTLHHAVQRDEIAHHGTT